MLISRAGLVRAKERLEKLRLSRQAKSDETKELYQTGGDAWHDNPMWHEECAERERLRAEMLELQAVLEEPFEFIDDLPDSNEVGPGSVVSLEYKGGERRHLTILGPLEVDIPRGVFSHRAPLPLALAGHKAGDTVTFNDQQIRIVSLERWEGFTSE